MSSHLTETLDSIRPDQRHVHRGRIKMVRNLGQKTERRILKKIGARRQPASGAIPGFPNDGVKNRYLIEVKSTQRVSLGLKRKWLEDLEENAISRSKIPALMIVFNAPDSLTRDSVSIESLCEWVAVPRRDFERITKEWKKS